MSRPLVFVGVDRQQAREAALAVCARAVSGGEARQLLRCLGLIPDPAVKGGQLGNPACHPLGDRGTEREQFQRFRGTRKLAVTP